MSSYTSVASLLCLEWSVLNVARLGGNLTFSDDGVMGDHRANYLSLIFFPPGSSWLVKWNRRQDFRQCAARLAICGSVSKTGDGLLADKHKKKMNQNQFYWPSLCTPNKEVDSSCLCSHYFIQEKQNIKVKSRNNKYSATQDCTNRVHFHKYKNKQIM